jgi:hypothetical protein
MKEMQLREKRQEAKPAKNEARRSRRVVFMLNEAEYNAIERYLRKYKITDRPNWYRSTILAHVWKMMEEDYPTLFNENEMRR